LISYFEVEVDVFAEFLFTGTVDVRVVYPLSLFRSFSHHILFKLLDLLRSELSVHDREIPDESLLRSGKSVVTNEISKPEVGSLSFRIGAVVSEKGERSHSGEFEEEAHVRLVFEIRVCFCELVQQWVHEVQESHSCSNPQIRPFVRVVRQPSQLLSFFLIETSLYIVLRSLRMEKVFWVT
jgi:hypothetical protein